MRRLTGLLACLGIVAVVAGVPVVLLHLGANPIPTGLTWSDVWARLTAPDDGTLIQALFVLLAWAAWAYFTLAILVEIASRARHIRAPRLPGFRPSQLAAQSLVGAAALLFAAAPLAAHAQPPTPAPAASHATHHNGQPSTATPAASRTVPAGPRGTARSDAAKTNAATTTHTVRPGESLSSIAEHELGDAHRWTEIAKLNYGRVQGDGHQLTHAHVIQPGWKLRLPADSTASADSTGKPAARGQTHRVHRGESLWSIAEDRLGSGEQYPQIVRASRTIEQPGGVHLTDPDVIEPGWIVRIPTPAAKTHTRHGEPPASTPKTTPRPPAPTPPREQSAPPPPSTTAPASPTESAPPATQPPARTGPATSSDTTTQSAPSSDDDGLDAPLPVAAAGVGTLLAAGVISLVAYRRRQQQRSRRPGRRLPMPTAAAAHTEQQLRATADPLSVETVDAALRGLARSCADTQRPLPTVRAARLTGDQFDLYLDEPTTLPAPWTGTADATVWTLLADHADQVDTDLAGIPAPFPALVTIGHDLDDGHVFLDLEYLTSLGLTGSPDLAAQVLAALAIELATSQWADDLQVTIVGAYPELEDALQTGRIRYLPSVGRVLDELGARAADDRAALAEAGVPDLNHARTTRQAPDAWTPEIVLIAGTLTERQRTQLDQLADATPRIAIATITSDEPIGEWALVLDDAGDTAVLEPIGLTLRPQRIDPDSYAHILELVATATDDQDAPRATTAHDSAGDGQDLRAADPAPASDQALDQVLATPTSQDLDDTAVRSTPTTGDGSTVDPTSPGLAAAADLAGEANAAPDDSFDRAVDAPEPVLTQPTPRQAALEPPSAQPANRPSEPETDFGGAVRPLASRKPQIGVLGPVAIDNATGTVEPSKKTRLLEYAAYLALHPATTPAAVDDAIWPSRTTEDNLNTRNTATSKLRAWIGRDPSGEFYLPRFSYAFTAAVTTDWDQWQQLAGPDPARAATVNLEQALSLVRGRPFEGTHLRRYAWAEPLKQEMISAIADVAYELAHRRLMDGRWRAADEAAARALSIEPGLERLWRIRILAAHEAHNQAAESEAIDRMLLTIDELGFDLEPETNRLLTALQDPKTDFDQLKEAL